MRFSRITYSEGIVGLGRDPGERMVRPPAGAGSVAEVRGAVEEALGRLSEEEREFVRCFYYMGCTVGEIAENSGREVYRLEGLHERVQRRLRACLGAFVRERYGFGGEPVRSCPICRAAQREKVEGVIAAKREEETWGMVMRELRGRFGLVVRSPQTLISHVKYHPQMGAGKAESRYDNNEKERSYERSEEAV